MTVHGDFSRELTERWAGVLYQQGRVFLDADGTAQTLITVNWQDTAARDVIGPGVAAVPAAAPASFRVDAADLAGGAVTLTVQPGRIWADGLLVRLGGRGPVQRRAGYLRPPVQDPPGRERTIANGVRDAVVLEVWREAVNGFQRPDELIEPALGGVDTTERLNTAFAFRLFRMAEGDTCESIRDRLGDHPREKGRLTVTLDPETVIDGDCPVVEAGGYSGFEHNLYRIEIAATRGRRPRFKWSQFNGGLVGRATFDAVAMRATITANLPAITASGLDAFYLEALRFDAALGRWAVVYGAEVTLDAEDRLVLPPTSVVGAIPGGPDAVFIRLWNGIERIGAFPPGPDPAELRDGIHLAFDPPAANRRYVPGDYWVFPVRAGDIENRGPFPTNAPPEGIRYHRVPLAVLEWDGTTHLDRAERTVEDCRSIVHPLTQLGTCCTYRVGDGVHSHGDFDSIQEAVDNLPPAGGEICVLPGVYTENVRIEGRHNVIISGCDRRSRVISAAPRDNEAPPVFHVRNSRAVQIRGLAVEAHETGIGILLEDTIAEQLGRWRDVGPSGLLSNLRLLDLFVRAATRPAIEVRGGLDVTIRECLVELRDARTTWPAVFFQGEDGLIERNVIRVRPPRAEISPEELRRLEGIANLPRLLLGLLSEGEPIVASFGFGGVQIGGLSERVRVVENVIQGGIGNGITLGSIRVVNAENVDTGARVGWVVNVDDPCDPCRPGDLVVVDPFPGEGGAAVRLVPAGPLRDIVIERNRILDMGLNGVGVIGFFNLLDETGLRRVVTVERLRIESNEIFRCLRRPIEQVRAGMLNQVGYGGITLAHVERLTIRGNRIEDNGPDHLYPVCGVFVLYGEGVEIAHNRIVNNGAPTDEPPSAAHLGRRGGINIALCTTTVDESDRIEQLGMRLEGTPALRVHGNVVSVPLGPALTVQAMGPVSVQGNSFTSAGVVPHPEQLASLFLRGATVTITNLGRSAEGSGTAKQVAGIAQGLARPTFRPSENPEFVTVSRGPRVGIANEGIANGFVLFSDNQCFLLPTRGLGGVDLSASVSILSTDDIGVHDNQCLTVLPEGALFTQALVLGDSVRATDNRFKEGPDDALFSAVTFGDINITAHNQATHCLLVRPQAPSDRVVDGPNIVVVTAAQQAYCNRFATILDQFGKVRG